MYAIRSYYDAAVTDSEALAAFHQLTRVEGIMPALESSHALAYATRLAATMDKDRIIIVNLSGVITSYSIHYTKLYEWLSYRNGFSVC